MPSLPEVLNISMQRALNEIHTCLPGRIESYDHTNQLASVLPLIKKTYRDGLVERLPVISNVPVVWPRTSSASLTFPLNSGDYVMLLFSERSMERFLSLGGEQEPGDTRKFDLTDAIAVPGLYPFSEPSLSENNEDVLLVYNSTKIRLKQNNDIDIEGANNANISIAQNMNETIGGNWTVDVSGSADVSATGNISLTAPTVAINGNLTVSGAATVGGGATITGSAAMLGGAVITGNTTISGSAIIDGDVTGSGVSLSTHVHGGVSTGPSVTGLPQ